jgi:WD40 repeat protein
MWRHVSLDLKSGKTSRTFSDNADHTFGMRFSNNGALLGVCESTFGDLSGPWFNKWIRLFDYESGKQVWSWHDKTNWRCDLADVAFSPNNATFATADRLLVRLWDFAAGQEILRLEHDESSLISSIAYSPDGERLAVATLDGPVWIWPLTPPQWKAAAQPLDRPSISSLWTQLAATDDAPHAYRAIWTLAASPTTVLPFLAKRLVPVPKYSPERIRQLIADLDHDDFHHREAALCNEASSFSKAAGSTGLTRWKSNPACSERRRSSS